MDVATSVPNIPQSTLWSSIREAIRGSHQDYTTGNLNRAILLLAIPMVLEMVLESLFAVVDVFFVGRLGADAVATVGLTESLLSLVFAVAIGLSMSITAMVARRIGEKDPEDASIAGVQAVILGLTVSLAVGIPSFIFAPRLLQLMGASPDIVVTGSGYARIALGGSGAIMMLFLNKNEPQGRIPAARFVRLGKHLGIPTLNDAAADVPPVENLFAHTLLGFDLVAVSGGKGLRGPQGAGLLLGRADLIHAARLNTAPHSDTIGRGLKVSKEEMVAMMVALEVYLQRDHQADWREWERRVDMIRQGLAAVLGVTTECFVPPIANQVPHARIRWDQRLVKVSPAEIVRQLRDGDPSIEVVPVPYEEGSVEIASWMLQPGEAEIIARRLGEAFASATRA